MPRRSHPRSRVSLSFSAFFQAVSTKLKNAALAFCAFDGVSEQPGAPLAGKRANRILRNVVVDGQATIVDIANQLGPLLIELRERLTELARSQCLCFQRLRECMQRIEQRYRTGLSRVTPLLV